jgi:TrmH family RNA methyltransferase
MKPIELASARNPRLKLVRQLADRRRRQEMGLFAVEGPHLVEAALGAGAKLREVFCTRESMERNEALAERLAASPWPVWVVPEAAMEKSASTENPQGVLAVAELLPDAPEPRVGPGLLALALEGVGDPGNVGSALRAAHAAGAMVILGSGCCDRFNAKAVRASAGGVFAVPTLATEDLAGLLAELRRGGARVVVADAKAAKVCWEVDLTGPTVLVIGNEARGVGEAVRALADEAVAVPMPGGSESLNAAAAAAVLLYEAVRQRNAARAGSG